VDVVEWRSLEVEADEEEKVERPVTFTPEMEAYLMASSADRPKTASINPLCIARNWESGEERPAEAIDSIRSIGPCSPQ
jgi:hypothetical protein